jgi:hypothetical protein
MVFNKVLSTNEISMIQNNMTFCNGIPSNHTSVCSGNGVCNNYDTCTCNVGWSGCFCDDELVCNGLKNIDPGVCSGVGKCISNEQCKCEGGYLGNYCQIFYCNGVLKNETNVCSSRGECVGIDKCSCTNGYYGNNCEFNSYLLILLLLIVPCIKIIKFKVAVVS